MKWLSLKKLPSSQQGGSIIMTMKCMSVCCWYNLFFHPVDLLTIFWIFIFHTFKWYHNLLHTVIRNSSKISISVKWCSRVLLHTGRNGISTCCVCATADWVCTVIAVHTTLEFLCRNLECIWEAMHFNCVVVIFPKLTSS